MTKTSIFLLASCSFLLGFVANEYRHQLTVAETRNAVTGDEPSLKPSTPSMTQNFTVTNAAEIAADSTKSQSEPFTWERIYQLIDHARYDEAVHLLQAHLNDNPNSIQAWLTLAQVYAKQGAHESALTAWFRYLDYEVDIVKREHAIEIIKRYLVQLYEKPSLFDQNSPWLITQLDTLLGLSENNGELHVILASLYAQLDDNYQAQYHALMAANDPTMKDRAEDILAQLDGTAISDELAVPLIRFGNQYLVNVSIEGNPARLLLDTGASISGLSNTYTTRYPYLIKSTKPIRLNTASGVENSYLFTVDKLTIESLAFNQHILALLPMNNMTDFDGLLGVDILGRFDFVIDQDALLLRLSARNP